MAQARVQLDALEFRSPITNFPTRDGGSIALTVDQVWQRRFSQLWRYVLDQTLIVPVTEPRTITPADSKSVILASNTPITLTLPLTSTPGDTYFFFNGSPAGTVTVAGNINGNPAGWDLTAQYDFVQVTSIGDGTVWIVTSKS